MQWYTYQFSLPTVMLSKPRTVMYRQARARPARATLYCMYVRHPLYNVMKRENTFSSVLLPFFLPLGLFSWCCDSSSLLGGMMLSPSSMEGLRLASSLSNGSFASSVSCSFSVSSSRWSLTAVFNSFSASAFWESVKIFAVS